MNNDIRATSLRVIDSEGRQLGVMTKAQALDIAREQELDLVEISPSANPPVAKIVNWGKFNYKRTKQIQKNKRNVKTPELKQMRFGMKIGDHDLAVKMKKVAVFFEAGHKVKLAVFFRGRELAHKELGFKLAERIINDYGDRIIVEQQPQLVGKQLIFVIRGASPVKQTSNIVDDSNIKEEASQTPVNNISKREIQEI